MLGMLIQQLDVICDQLVSRRGLRVPDSGIPFIA